MPPTKKKVARLTKTGDKNKKATKKAVSKKTTPKTTNKKIDIEKTILPEKEFIDIYKKDPIIEARTRIAWIIIGILGIILLSFWFWTIKIKTTIINDNQTQEDTTKIDQSIKDFKDIINSTKEMIGYANEELLKEQEVEKIKSEVIQQIQVNLESEYWPQHSSELINISFNYPENWSKEEAKNSITISSYDLKATSSPEIFTTIEIKKIDKINIDSQTYKESQEEIFVDLIPAKKYINDQNEKDISFIITIDYKDKIHEIKVYSKNGKNLFEPLINKILSTIDLI